EIAGEARVGERLSRRAYGQVAPRVHIDLRARLVVAPPADDGIAVRIHRDLRVRRLGAGRRRVDDERRAGGNAVGAVAARENLDRRGRIDRTIVFGPRDHEAAVRGHRHARGALRRGRLDVRLEFGAEGGAARAVALPAHTPA